MLNAQAYPDGSAPTDRFRRRFKIGEYVKIGPAYQGNGQYAPDGCPGYGVIVSEIPPSTVSPSPGYDYKIARTVEDARLGDWHVIVNSSRLMPA